MMIPAPPLLLRWAAVMTVVVLAAPGQAQQSRSAAAGPFASLIGSWSGTGSASLSNGTSERIRCQAAYAAGTSVNNLRSVLRCASDSYRFELASDVVEQGGTFSGAWRETSRNITGQITGTTSRGGLQAQISTPGFGAALSIVPRGDRQVVSVRTQGTELTGVSITLSRR